MLAIGVVNCQDSCRYSRASLPFEFMVWLHTCCWRIKALPHAPSFVPSLMIWIRFIATQLLVFFIVSLPQPSLLFWVLPFWLLYPLQPLANQPQCLRTTLLLLMIRHSVNVSFLALKVVIHNCFCIPPFAICHEAPVVGSFPVVDCQQ